VLGRGLAEQRAAERALAIVDRDRAAAFEQFCPEPLLECDLVPSVGALSLSGVGGGRLRFCGKDAGLIRGITTKRKFRSIRRRPTSRGEELQRPVPQLTAMSISFYVHLYFDKHYHVAGSWLGRFAWFRRKQQLHFLHHRHADCNFAVVDNFWDWLLGTYRSIDAHRET